MSTDIVWYGPRTLTKLRQVCIPVDLLGALDLYAGSEVQFALTPEGTEIRIKPTGRSRKDAGRRTDA